MDTFVAARMTPARAASQKGAEKQRKPCPNGKHLLGACVDHVVWAFQADTDPCGRSINTGPDCLFVDRAGSLNNPNGRGVGLRASLVFQVREMMCRQNSNADATVTGGLDGWMRG